MTPVQVILYKGYCIEIYSVVDICILKYTAKIKDSNDRTIVDLNSTGIVLESIDDISNIAKTTVNQLHG